jgi:hypothetical protein
MFESTTGDGALTSKLRPLGWAAYAVAFLLIVFPLADTFVGVWPPRIGEVTWRFGAAGLVSRSVMTPLFGTLVALVTAALLEHRLLARVLSLGAFIGAILGILAMVMFGLDAIQARSGVRPEAIPAFDTATISAFAKYIVGTITAVLLGVGGWKAAGKRSAPAGAASGKASQEAASPVLVSSENR